MDIDPLRAAAELAGLAALRRAPEPGTLLHDATAPLTLSIRARPLEKSTYDALQRAMGVALGRRVSQPELLRWLLAFALARREEFLSAAGTLADDGWEKT